MPQKNKPATLPDADEARRMAIRDRNRKIALEVISRGDERGDRAAVAGHFNVDRYVVTRAMNAEGDWARKQKAEVERARSDESGQARHIELR